MRLHLVVSVHPNRNETVPHRIRDREKEFRLQNMSAELKTRAYNSGEICTFTLCNYALGDGLSVNSGVVDSYESTVVIPENTPNTIGSIDVWFEFTARAGNLTKEKMKHVGVVISDQFQKVVDSAIEAGLALRNTRCLLDSKFDSSTFIQELTFSKQDEIDSNNIFIYLQRDSPDLLVHITDHRITDCCLSDSTVTTLNRTDEEIQTQIHSLVDDVQQTD